MVFLKKTTKKNGHNHSFKPGNKFTSFAGGHRHKVVNGRILKGKQNHGHTFLKNGR